MQNNNFLEKFASLKNLHGHTSIDHFLLGVKTANKQSILKLKEIKGPDACSMCCGDGVLIEIVRQFSRLMSPVSTFNRYTTCHGCLGTGLDLEKIRNRKKAVAA